MSFVRDHRNTDYGLICAREMLGISHWVAIRKNKLGDKGLKDFLKDGKRQRSCVYSTACTVSISLPRVRYTNTMWYVTSRKGLSEQEQDYTTRVVWQCRQGQIYKKCGMRARNVIYLGTHVSCPDASPLEMLMIPEDKVSEKVKKSN